MAKRATVQQTLDNLETLYFANASLGTPQQNVRLHIDTGSSDLWVNTPKSQLCSSSGSPCAQAGTYTANSSSTYSYVNSLFNISYVDGSGALGDYVTDTFHFGGKSLSNFEFGIGYTTSSQEGILGIGYQNNEVIVNRANQQPYANLPTALVQQGYTSVTAYSLWLNDLDASTGSILFGGVDTQKYHGSLAVLPVIPTTKNFYAELVVAMTGLSLGSQSLISNDNVPVLLDSGSSLIYLPDDAVNSIYKSTGAQYNSQQGYAYVDCSLANNSTTLNFQFSSMTISVPMNELVVTIAVSRRGVATCVLGIGPSGGSSSVLGDTFLRSAYVVYDLNSNQIALAQTNFNATQSNVMEISNGTSGIPNASGVSNPVTSIAYSTGGARNGGQTTATSTGAAAAMRTPPPVMAPALALGAAGMLFAL